MKQGVARRVQKRDREMTSSLFESHLSLFLLCAQHNHLILFCRADAVKDERSEVNHKIAVFHPKIAPKFFIKLLGPFNFG